MQSNWFTPLNMCQVSDVQPSITAQQQLRLIESWCSSAGPQGVLACQHLQSRDWAEKPVHRSVPWSLVLWAFSKHHRLDWDHPASHYSATQIQFGFQIQSDWTICTVYPCIQYCQYPNYQMKVWSHLPLIGKISKSKFSNSKRNPHNQEICVRADKVHHADFAQVQVGRVNLPCWPTESFMVWKWLLCEQCLIYLYTIDNG